MDDNKPNHTTINSNNLPTIGFIRLDKILRVIPICRSVWYKGVKEGRYPQPIQISERCVAWRAEDIHALIEKLNNQQ